MINSEEMIVAARIMRDAAEKNRRQADRIEEALRQFQILFDAAYGGAACQLLEELQKPRCK